MVRWHHQLNGHESEQIPGDSEDREAWRATVLRVTKESDMTWQINNNGDRHTLVLF